MAVQTYPRSEPRRPWNRGQLLRAAIDLADTGGIESLSMRKLSQELGGGTMSLYNHVSNKDDLVDGMIDIVFSEIELPAHEHRW
jgi:AcrR family transcriptional regulator